MSESLSADSLLAEEHVKPEFADLEQEVVVAVDAARQFATSLHLFRSGAEAVGQRRPFLGLGVASSVAAGWSR